MIPILIRRNKQSRSLKLRIDPILKAPILTVPKRCSQKEIDQFLTSAEPWLTENLKMWSRDFPSSLLWYGEHFNVILSDQYEPLLQREKKCLILSESNPQKSLQGLLKKETLPIVKRVCLAFAQELNVTFDCIHVRDYRSRWGSCSYARKHLAFSFRLLLAPPSVLSYVCAHEVSHLLHPHHKAIFWGTVETLWPYYRSDRLWLKQHGKTLFL